MRAPFCVPVLLQEIGANRDLRQRNFLYNEKGGSLIKDASSGKIEDIRDEDSSISQKRNDIPVFCPSDIVCFCLYAGNDHVI